EDLIGDPVLIEIVDPEFYGMGAIRMEVEILADVSQDEIGQTVAVEIGDGHGFPPAIPVGEIGLHLVEMVVFPGKDVRRHPFAYDDEVFDAVTDDVRIRGGGDHADAGDVGVFGGRDVGEMTMTVIDKNER